MTGSGAGTPHLPRPALIDAYGNGGFRFAGMSHRGSLLCLPDGVWAWPVAEKAELTEALLEPFFTRAGILDIVLIGGGRDPWVLPEPIRARFSEAHVSVDAMTTAAAVATYNVLLAEDRRVAAALIAVD
jgi:uncharacterized protein